MSTHRVRRLRTATHSCPTSHSCPACVPSLLPEIPARLRSSQHSPAPSGEGPGLLSLALTDYHAQPSLVQSQDLDLIGVCGGQAQAPELPLMTSSSMDTPQDLRSESQMVFRLPVEEERTPLPGDILSQVPARRQKEAIIAPELLAGRERGSSRLSYL